MENACKFLTTFPQHYIYLSVDKDKVMSLHEYCHINDTRINQGWNLSNKLAEVIIFVIDDSDS